MFNLSQFISDHIIHRQESMFLKDIEANKAELTSEIEDKSVCVIGGAGSIGSSFIQLEHIEEYVEDKRKTAAQYAEFFKDMEDIKFFSEPENTRSNYWLNVVLLKDKVFAYRFV